MSGERIMHQVVAPVHGPDGLSVLFGPGELHEPGGLPEGVAYRAVVADEVDREIAPAWAQAAAEPEPEPPKPAKAETETAPPPAPAPEAAASGKGSFRK